MSKSAANLNSDKNFTKEEIKIRKSSEANSLYVNTVLPNLIDERKEKRTSLTTSSAAKLVKKATGTCEFL